MCGLARSPALAATCWLHTTSTWADCVTPEPSAAVQVMTVEPWATPVTLPFSSTLATAGLEEVQVTALL